MSNAIDYDVYIGGRNLKLYDNLEILSITFEENLEETAKLKIVIMMKSDSAISPEDIIPKMKVRVQLKQSRFRYINQLIRKDLVINTTDLFYGNIYRIIPLLGSNSHDTIEIVCYDSSAKLKKTNKFMTISDTNYSAIIKSMESDYPDVRFNIDHASLARAFKINTDQAVVYEDKTDWEIIHDLAKKGGFRLFAFNDMIFMKSDDAIIQDLQGAKFNMIFNPEKLKTDNNEIPLIDFKPEYNTSGQISEVEIISWKSAPIRDEIRREELEDGQRNELNYKNLTHDTEIEVSYIGRRETIKIVSEAVNSIEQAEKIAKAELKRRSEKLITGGGVIEGNPLLRMGQKHHVEVNAMGKFGKQFSGDYLIYGTKHRISAGQAYMTEFEVRRDHVSKVA